MGFEMIFDKVIPGETDTWEKQYLKFLRRYGKGHKVEELMDALTQDVLLIVNHEVVRSATVEQDFQLENIRKEMISLEGANIEETFSTLALQSGGGVQTNNINNGNGQYINNNGHVGTHQTISGKEGS